MNTKSLSNGSRGQAAGRRIILSFTLFLTACAHKGTNPIDPYEPFNRKIDTFNRTLDKVILKPPARVYKAVVPATVRRSVNNFFLNIYHIPIVVNDLLQANLKAASNDAGRLVLNSTLGVAGLFDVATGYHLPYHYNDLGLTFAHWGDKESPYIVIPFLGPSTIRDGMGLAFEYSVLSPFAYIESSLLLTGVVGLRYVDLRSQYLETEHLLDEALDKYTFMRDAWLQNRHYLITGETPATETAEAQGEPGNDYVDE